MNLFAFVPVRLWILAAAAMMTGIVSGAFSAGLLAFINRALNNLDRSQRLLAVGFAGLIVGKILANAIARLLLNYFTQETISELYRMLSRRVLATPLAQLERVGIPRILVTLTEDVAMIGWAAQNIPSFAMNIAILVGCAIYLGWLSWQILIWVTVLVVIGSIGYSILIRRAYKYLQHARETRDVLFQHFRGLTDGIKELKLHAGRREAFLFGPNRDCNGGSSTRCARWGPASHSCGFVFSITFLWSHWGDDFRNYCYSEPRRRGADGLRLGPALHYEPYVGFDGGVVDFCACPDRVGES